MAERYGVRDLVRVQVNAVRYGGAHPDLASFYRRRFQAFAAAFGVDDRVEFARHGRNRLEGLAAASIDTLIGLHSPFGGYLAAPKAVIDLAQRYGPAINDALGQTERAIEDLLVGIFLEMHDLTEHRTIESEQLRSAQFDPYEPWPDELDYW